MLASQATTASGSPSAAAPAPVSTSSPLRVRVMPTSRMSTLGERARPGSTTATAPLEARSATVSASLIRQSANRESTISTDAHDAGDRAGRVGDQHAGPLESLAEDEDDLGLDLGLDEACDSETVSPSR